MSEIERLSGIGLSSNLRNIPIPTGSAEECTARGEMKRGGKRPFTVIVEGNIGSGKTTFLQHFSKFKHVDLLTEPVDKWRDLNGYNLLQRMYEDPARWSLTFQTYVQLTMLENHVKKSGLEIKMMERSIHSAKFCFVENLYKTGKMPASEYQVISAWFDFLKENPSIDLGVDLIVYLQTTPEKALERVKARSRGEEHMIPLKYLNELHNLHEDWLVHEKFPLPAPVIILDANKSLKELQVDCLDLENKILTGFDKENKIVGDFDKENVILGDGELKENIDNSHVKKQNVDRSPLKPRLSGAVSN